MSALPRYEQKLLRHAPMVGLQWPPSRARWLTVYDTASRIQVVKVAIGPPAATGQWRVRAPSGRCWWLSSLARSRVSSYQVANHESVAPAGLAPGQNSLLTRVQGRLKRASGWREPFVPRPRRRLSALAHLRCSRRQHSGHIGSTSPTSRRGERHNRLAKSTRHANAQWRGAAEPAWLS